MFTEKLKYYMKSLMQESMTPMSSWSDEERTTVLEVISEHLLLDYVHLALHLVLNTAYELERLRPEDIEHYVTIKSDKRALVERFLESLIYGKPYTDETPASIEIAITSDADVVGKVRWEQVSNRLEEMAKILESQPDMSILREMIVKLYIPRCFNTPAYIEDLLERGSENYIEVIKELRTIIEIGKTLVNEIVKYFAGIQ